MMRPGNYVVSCDWFAVSVDTRGGHTPSLGDTFQDPDSAHSYIVGESAERHPFFESSCLMYEGRGSVCHVFYRPKRDSMVDSALVKVDNSRLYYARWDESLLACIRALGWRVRFINRVDICCDFNYFANQRLPLRFVQDYLSKPTATRPSFVRRGSNKFHAIGERSLRTLNYETLRWGNRDSPVQVNLYNKSLELQDHADKPWIRDRWADVGLLHGDVDGHKHYVWRVEFSINPGAVTWQSKDMQHVRELSIDDVSTPYKLLDTFAAFVPRYFQFYYLTKAASRSPKVRVRDLQPVVLFDALNAAPYHPAPLRYYTKSDRTDRLLLRRLVSHVDEMQLDASEAAAVYTVVGLLQRRLSLTEDDAMCNLLNATLDDYLAQMLHDHDVVPRVSAAQPLRKAKRWVRVMRGAHDPDTERFMDALAKLEDLTGTAVFESLMQAGDYVAASAMPDEAISQWVDEDVERSILADYYG